MWSLSFIPNCELKKNCTNFLLLFFAINDVFRNSAYLQKCPSASCKNNNIQIYTVSDRQQIACRTTQNSKNFQLLRPITYHRHHSHHSTGRQPKAFHRLTSKLYDALLSLITVRHNEATAPAFFGTVWKLVTY